MSPRRSLTTNVLPSRMLIRRGCTLHSLPARTIFKLHVRPNRAFIRRYRGYCNSVADPAEESPYRSHQRLRIAMVAPPWYELPPVGYGGLEAIRLVPISRAQRLSRTELNWAGAVHNALPPDAVEGGRATPDGPVLWLARFTPDKGPDLAVQACQAAGVPLVLAGKCNEPEEE